MATITIEYDDGTSAHWEMEDDEVESKIEPILGDPFSIRC